jgi:Flp pilus assembly protein TadD
MLMSFISKRLPGALSVRVSCAALLLAALSACGGGATLDQGAQADTSAPASSESAVQRSAAQVPRPELPTPDVKRGNLSAFEQAVVAMQEERMLDAEILLLEITADQPELAGPWINLGQVYVALGQEEEARLAFKQAIEANPYNCTAYNELGVLSRRYGDFAGAEEQYLTCIQLVPEFKDAYLNLGILYELYLGKLSEALEYYRTYQSLSAEPDRRVQGWVMDLERRIGS